VGDVQPIGNHAAGRVYDVQRACVLLNRTRENHAVGVSVVDGRSVDGNVFRCCFLEADFTLHVLDHMSGLVRGVGAVVRLAGCEAGNGAGGEIIRLAYAVRRR